VHIRHLGGAVGVALLLAGCASAGGVSTEQEVQLGAQEAQQINAQLPMLNDAQIDNYVNQLGQSIAATTSRSDLQWHFAVVNSSDVNAFALPGGFVYVNRGILEHASNASELAGVLGHEIEHVVRRHSVKQMAQVQNANVGVELACALTGVCNNQAVAAGVNVAGGAYFMMNKLTGTWRSQTLKKYEQRKQDQRERFGHDVAGRAREAAAAAALAAAEARRSGRQKGH